MSRPTEPVASIEQWKQKCFEYTKDNAEDFLVTVIERGFDAMKAVAANNVKVTQFALASLESARENAQQLDGLRNDPIRDFMYGVFQSMGVVLKQVNDERDEFRRTVDNRDQTIQRLEATIASMVAANQNPPETRNDAVVDEAVIKEEPKELRDADDTDGDTAVPTLEAANLPVEHQMLPDPMDDEAVIKEEPEPVEQPEMNDPTGGAAIPDDNVLNEFTPKEEEWSELEPVEDQYAPEEQNAIKTEMPDSSGAEEMEDNCNVAAAHQGVNEELIDTSLNNYADEPINDETPSARKSVAKKPRRASKRVKMAEMEEDTDQEPDVETPGVKRRRLAKIKHENNENMKCLECYFSTKSPVSFRLHKDNRHGVKMGDSGLCFVCDNCGVESLTGSVRHRKNCSEPRFKVICKLDEMTESKKCVKLDESKNCLKCDKSFPYSVRGYSTHLSVQHQTSLGKEGIFLKCACGKNVLSNTLRGHDPNCDGRSFTIHKLSELNEESE